MRPVIFDSCVGWLYPANPDKAVGRGVVLCGSFGYEALCVQRAMVALATMLADAGIPTLRFHYHGTGDSAGEEAPGQIERWIDSIDAAIAELKRSTGVTEVALCGHRLGGTLAIEAAQRRDDIAALALLAPVMSGRAFVRELTLSASMVEHREDVVVSSDWIEVLGYRLHKLDTARLRKIELKRHWGAGLAARVLLLSPDEAPADLDPRVEVRPFLDYDGLTQHTENVYVPMRAFRLTVDWLRREAPAAAAAPPFVAREPELKLPGGIVERPVLFGRGGGRFGVLTRPMGWAKPRAVLILNTGLNDHTGNGRGSVRLARRLAGQGFTALRIDADKIGDSLPVDPTERVGFHDLGRIQDVQAALDILTGEGLEDALVVGICAGAYLGLHALAHDRRIAGAVLANLPYFYVAEEDPAVPMWRKPFSVASRFLHVTREWRTRWRLNHSAMPGHKLLNRRRLQNFMRGLHYVRQGLWHAVLTPLRWVVPTDWAIGQPDRLLKRIHALGKRVVLAYSPNDLARVELKSAYPDGGKRIEQLGWVHIVSCEGADHAMTMTTMQDAYARLIEDELGVHRSEVAPDHTKAVSARV